MSTQTRNEIRDDVAAIGEQFRKTTEAAAEQTRKTLGATQERIQENLSRAQQVQNDWARMLFRLSEQSGHIATAAVTSLWDTSLNSLKLAVWGEEQLERTLLRSVEQHRHTREEGVALLKETADQALHNQAELYRLAQETLNVGLFYAGKTARRESEAATK